MRLLLIDDHEVSRAACRALLRTEGVEVVGDLAPDEEAVTAVANRAPDIVVVDLSPGDQTGLDFAYRIRAVARAVLITSSAPRSAFHDDLDGFAFVAKAEICKPTLQGATMTSSTSRTARASESLWFLNNLAIIHARSDDARGSYAVVELAGRPGDTPPLHVHHHDDEGFYVLDGAIRLHIGDGDAIGLQPGEFALAPRGVPHVYVVESEAPARWLTVSNGGFDRFVEEVSVPASEPVLPTEPHTPSPEELTAIAARHGIEILGPPGTVPERSWRQTSSALN